MFVKKLMNLFGQFKFSPNDVNTMPSRRVDLDWLRICLFGLLIVHHIGMFYVANWGWHAKSEFRSEWLESVLLIVEPWRMPAIWLISGVAIRFILAKVSLVRFVSLRSLRLLLPLLFGVLIVVPPQLYVEMSAKGEIDMGFLQFMQAFYVSDHPIFENYTWGIWPHIDVNHLWYLRSLWYYSLSLVLLLPILNSQLVTSLVNWIGDRPAWLAIGFLFLPVLVIESFWELSSSRYPIGFLFLVLGYTLGWHPQIWDRLKQGLTSLSVAYLAVLVALVIGYNLFWIDVIQGGQASLAQEVFVQLVYSMARVVGLLMVLAFAARFLSKKTPSLDYFNDAVYPFYILHQTLILVAGFYLSKFALTPFSEVILVSLLTLGGCFVLFEIIRRIDLLRPFFGLKVTTQYQPGVNRLGYLVGAILVLPLALKLLL